MAAVLSGIAKSDAGNGTSYVTAAFTPAAGDYLIVTVYATDTTVNGTVTDSQGLSWSSITSNSAPSAGRIVAFRSTTTTTATSMTVTFDCTGDAATGALMSVIRVSGSDGNIRQSAISSGVAANAPSATFASAALTSSVVLFGIANTSNPHGNTAPTGFTLRSSAGIAAPTAGFVVYSVNSGITASTITAAAASATDWSSISLEIYNTGVTTQTLTPALFTNSNTFFTHTISSGSSTQTLTPSLFTNASTFFAAVVAAGAITLSPGLFTNANSFYAPTVSQAITPSLFANSNTFYTHQLAPGAVSLTPSIYTNSNTFYTHTLAGESVNLTPSLFTNSNTFYSASIGVAYPVRYIRDSLNGSAGNGASYWVEIQAFDIAGTNIASGKTVTSNFTPNGALSLITDGDTNTNNYSASFESYSRVKVDLGATYNIASVTRWHYNGDNRTFYDTKTETSVDGVTWTVLFNSATSGGYAEQTGGKNNVTLPQPPVNAQQISTIIPAYTETSTVWDAYTSTASIQNSYAIINPNGGPGTVVNNVITGQVTAYHNAGGSIIGYVSSSYAGTVNTARTVAAVKADINTYRSLYDVDGFFIDEMTAANTGGNIAYYNEVYAYIKSLNAAYFVCGNVGLIPAEIYVSTPVADNFVTFEGTFATFANFAMPAWTDNYPSTKFSWIVLATSNSSDAQSVVIRARNENTRYVFVTNDVTPNPYDILPSYWTALTTAMAGTGASGLKPRLSHANTNTFYSPTVAAGQVTLSPSLFTNTSIFYSPTVSSGAGNLLPSLFTNSNTYFTHSISAGSVSLTPSLHTNASTFYTHTVSPGAATLAPSLFSNSNTFYAPTISSGAGNLLPSLFTNSNTFFTHSIAAGSVGLNPGLYTNSNSFYTHVVAAGSVTLSPSLYTNSNTFYSPTVTAGAVSIVPALFNNSNTFYSHTVTAGSVNLTPGLFSNSNTFFAAVVTAGAVGITPSLYTNASTFYTHTIAVDANILSSTVISVSYKLQSIEIDSAQPSIAVSYKTQTIKAKI